MFMIKNFSRRMMRLESSLLIRELPMQVRRGVGSRGSNKLPLQVIDGGLKTQAVNFQLLANSGGMENKLWVF